MRDSLALMWKPVSDKTKIQLFHALTGIPLAEAVDVDELAKARLGHEPRGLDRESVLVSEKTDENDSDEILTQGGLSTEVTEREIPFAVYADLAVRALGVWKTFTVSFPNRLMRSD